jgi:hypothetical protein
MKPSQVTTFGELVVVITVVVIHQAPPTTYQREDACSLNIALGGLAESVKKFPCGRLIYVFKDILPNAFMGSCNGIAADNGQTIVQWTIVETVVADGITNLLLLGSIACEIYKEIMGGC